MQKSTKIASISCTFFRNCTNLMQFLYLSLKVMQFRFSSMKEW